MDPLAFALAVLTVLATPGPTNTVLAASGASVGFVRSLKLVPAELSGYLLSITTLISLFAPVAAQYPFAALGLKGLASLWLAIYAFKLWRQAGAEIDIAAASISARQVFVTTLLNPKGLIFALGIFPHGSMIQEVPWFVGFSCLAVVAALSWVGIGSFVARSAGSLVTPQRIGQAAALCLFVFAIVIAGSAIAASL